MNEIQDAIIHLEDNGADSIVGMANGEEIVVTDSSSKGLVGLNIYGKSTLDGTPTLDAPIDIVSVGDDGDVAVTVGVNTLSLTLADSLRGIPVKDTSLATYTDATGQMWCADEIDLSRGVRIRRLNTIAFNGTETWVAASTNFSNCVAFNHNTVGKHTSNGAWTAVMSNVTPMIAATEYTNVDTNGVGGYGASITFKILKTALGSKAETNDGVLGDWLSYLATQASMGTPVVAQYILANPTETILSEDEIAAYKALHTNKPNTTIINDAGAYMSIKYIADTKSYIDNKVSSAILAATVE